MRGSAAGTAPGGAVALTWTVWIALFALQLGAFYPGYLTADPVTQLYEIRGLVPVNDWHPPFITAVWHVIDRVVGAPGPIFVVQTALWTSAVAFVATAVSQRTAVRVLLSIALVTWPPLFAQLSMLWKDSWFVAFALHAYAHALLFARTGRARYAVAGMLASAATMLTRFNGVVVALPAAAWLGFEIALRAPVLPRRRVTALGAVAATIAALAGAIAVSSALGRFYVARHVEPWAVTPLYDVVGISVRSGDLRLPPGMSAYRGKTATLEELRRLYRADSSDALIWGSGEHFQFEVPETVNELPPFTSAQRRAILSTWAASVMAHPGAYLAHRAAAFREQVGLGERRVHAPYVPVVIPNALGFTYEPSRLNRAVRPVLDRTTRWLVFRPVVYAVAAMLLAGISLRRGAPRGARALVASAVLLLASNFFLLPDPDLRYSVWVVVACVVTIAIELEARAQRRAVAR